MHPSFGRYELLKRLAEIPFASHAMPQIGRALKLQLTVAF